MPRRGAGDASHQTALLIRDGRRVAQQLASIAEPSKTSLSSRETFSRLSGPVTSMSTVGLEQDFTVEGKKGSLACPFSAAQRAASQGVNGAAEAEGEGEAVCDTTPHHSADPICAAMMEEATSQPPPAGRSKCPIRYLDKHSPEEIADYVKAHKHELPRSHAVCVERYQRSEDQIRKLDAKYGSMVTMIEGLGQLHKPMLPVSEDPPEEGVDNDASNKRVENWAHDVGEKISELPAAVEFPHNGEESDAEGNEEADDAGRESHFDRPMKEIRVGESPSRPWGISVPIYDVNENGDQPLSPPPAPVLMPSSSMPDTQQEEPRSPSKPAGKCPFDHTKLAGMNGLGLSQPAAEDKPSEASRPPVTERPPTPQKQEANTRASLPQPTFLNMPQPTQAGSGNSPQMVFTGPVFIGYPMDEAIKFMQAFQGR